MLYMTIFSYEPDRRDEVLKRAATKGMLMPEGAKMVGAWSAVGGGRVFRVMDVDDHRIAVQAARAWSDLGRIEVIPVMDTLELVQMLSKA